MAVIAAFTDLDLPAVVRDVVRVPAHRRLRVLEDTVIEVGGRLELGPGVTVAVATGKGLYVKGGELFARGTSKEPIVFTSLAARPQPGDWCGVVFDWDELLKQSGEVRRLDTSDNIFSHVSPPVATRH